MKNLLLLGFILISGSVFGQISINKSDMPSPGDTIRYSSTNATIDVSSTGPNHNWDFKNIQASAQGVAEYKASSRTPYILNFGFSAIGLKIADTIGTGQLQLKNLYNFYKKSDSKFEAVGTGFQYAALPLPQAGKHSNTEIIYEFPLTYDDQNSDDYYVEIPIALGPITAGSLIRSGVRKTKVDGWGKISTPYASNVECIRVKAEIDAYDSVNISTLNVDFGLPTRTIEYKWLSKTEKIPMMEVIGTMVGQNFIPSQIRYRDVPRKISRPTAVTVLFEADDTMPVTGADVQLNNLTDGFFQNFNWTITPETGFQFVQGTTRNDENPVVRFSEPGSYSVKLELGNIIPLGSATKNDYINVTRNAGTGFIPVSGLAIYPNPASDFVQIDIPDGHGIFQIEIYDLNGQMVFEKLIRESRKISLSAFANGQYLIRLSNDDFQMEKEFIKN